MPDPRKFEKPPEVDLVVEYAGLLGEAQDLADDATQTDEVRAFAAAMIPVLESMQYAEDVPHWSRPGDADAFVAQGGALGAPQAGRPPIWAN